MSGKVKKVTVQYEITFRFDTTLPGPKNVWTNHIEGALDWFLEGFNKLIDACGFQASWSRIGYEEDENG